MMIHFYKIVLRNVKYSTLIRIVFSTYYHSKQLLLPCLRFLFFFSLYKGYVNFIHAAYEKKNMIDDKSRLFELLIILPHNNAVNVTTQ